MLLIGISRENCELVAKRIEGKFNRAPASRGVYCRWEFESTASLTQEDVFLNDADNREADAPSD